MLSEHSQGHRSAVVRDHQPTPEGIGGDEPYGLLLLLLLLLLLFMVMVSPLADAPDGTTYSTTRHSLRPGRGLGQLGW